MSDYKRVKLHGGLYFFTVVTFNRRKFLTSELARSILRQVWKEVQGNHPFDVEAICLIPDHLHCIWRLPQGDCDYPKRWRLIKGKFSKRYLKAGGSQGVRNDSRQKKGEFAVWQRRYWEHTIMDDRDFVRHVDYIHINPVKHGYVNKACDWKWSSFHRYLKLGYYSEGWGCADIDFADKNEFGE
ncbi:transposase [candidate division KSB1 bacterium]|nr:transposase [candidate division KSB1 bacterium]